MRPSPTLNEYLDARLSVGPGECWIWTGKINGSGYGEVVLRTKYAGQAHRLMYERMIAPIPEGLVLDHLCRVRSCVNPWHLEPVCQRTNESRSRRRRAA